MKENEFPDSCAAFLSPRSLVDKEVYGFASADMALNKPIEKPKRRSLSMLKKRLKRKTAQQSRKLNRRQKR